MDWLIEAVYKASLVGAGWGILIAIYKLTFGRQVNNPTKSTDETFEQNDEHLYEQVYEEFHSRSRKRGLYLKLLTNNDGDKEKAEFAYIKARVKEIKNQTIAPKEKKKIDTVIEKKAVKAANELTIFQRIIRALGLPSWFEDLMIFNLFVLFIYLIFNFNSFFR